MKTLQPGDRVKLINGGPTMNVIGEGEMPGEVCCEWTSDGELVCGTFLDCALVKSPTIAEEKAVS